MVDAERNITPAHNSEDAAAAAAFSPVDTEAEGAFPAESPMVAPGSNAREGGSISFEELARLLHCSPEDVQATAATLDKDPDKAREMLKSLAPAYLAVKGRFEARRRGEVNGGFCIVADGHSGTLVDSVVWVGTYELPQGFTAAVGVRSGGSHRHFRIPRSPDVPQDPVHSRATSHSYGDERSLSVLRCHGDLCHEAERILERPVSDGIHRGRSHGAFQSASPRHVFSGKKTGRTERGTKEIYHQRKADPA